MFSLGYGAAAAHRQSDGFRTCTTLVSSSQIMIENVNPAILDAPVDHSLRFVRVWSFEWEDGRRFSQAPRLIKQVSVKPFAPRGFERSSAVAAMDHMTGKVLCGTLTNSILEIDLDAMEQTGHDVKHGSVRTVHAGHCGQSLRDKKLKVLLPSLQVTACASFPSPSVIRPPPLPAKLVLQICMVLCCRTKRSEMWLRLSLPLGRMYHDKNDDITYARK